MHFQIFQNVKVCECMDVCKCMVYEYIGALAHGCMSVRVHLCVSCASVWGHRTHLHLNIKQFSVLLCMVSRVCELRAVTVSYILTGFCVFLCTCGCAQAFMHDESDWRVSIGAYVEYYNLYGINSQGSSCTPS